MAETTSAWDLYQRGKDYHGQINLVANMDKAYRMMEGDQWNGVVSNGLPTPVFNILKRVVNHFISCVMSENIAMQFYPENVPKEPTDEQDMYKVLAAGIVTEQCRSLWERLKMNYNLRHVLRDGAVSGDMCGYTFWDSSLITANPVAGVTPTGDINFELVDGLNVMFGNPQDYRVNTQPYILLIFRQMTADLIAEAKRNKASKKDIDAIVPDSDYFEMAGDRAKIELSKAGENGKSTAIVKFWRDTETGKIMWNKSTKAAVIIKDTDSGLTRYPITWGCWDYKKNSYHGESVILSLIPNQIFINKMFAMVMLNLMQTAFPKAIYNANIVDKWTNQIGEAIAANGADDMRNVATYLQPAQMSSQVMNVIDAAINYTKELVGASDVALGNIKPDNHSAIIAVQQAAMIPLETIKQNLYQWCEDLGHIFFDFMAHKYGTREVIYKGQKIEFNFDELQSMQMNLKIDVGASSYWSEISSAQTLDALLKDAKIDFLQYLERMPEGYIPQKQELIDEIKKNMENKANMPEAPIDKPSVSINFLDLPVPGRVQLAQQIGIQLQESDFPEVAQNKQLMQALADDQTGMASEALRQANGEV